MSILFILWHIVWFVRVALHLVLATLVVRQKVYRDFPLFVIYIIWTALMSAVLVCMNYSPLVSGNAYAIAFAISTGTRDLLSFAVIYEAFLHVLRDYPVLRHTGTNLLRSAAVALLIIVIALAWLNPAQSESPAMSVFFLLQRTANILVCGLLLFVFGFSGYFGLSRRSFVSGITLGMGILATVGLATTAIRSQIEPIERNQTTNLMELITQSAYLCSVVVWIAYLFIQERNPDRPVRRLPPDDLEPWNRELERLLHQ